ncbi:SitI3 family protein [Micromonospora sp. NPDC047753]|uniref:SitI3 family protein n=1 Tax=Micromonospora sp. NPDC047753 TaxID=3154817 RepID=UPI0033F2FC20
MSHSTPPSDDPSTRHPPDAAVCPPADLRREMACCVCRRILNTYFDATGRLRHLHPAARTSYDHDPDPVPSAEVAGVARSCDFCSDRYPVFRLDSGPVQALAQWEWEPGTYVNIVFHLPNNGRSDRATPKMVAAVARVLAGSPDDAALVLDGNWLLLTRVAGTLRKHRPSWWDNCGVNQLLA